MNIMHKTRTDKSTIILSKDKNKDQQKKEKNYPNGPNEKQGYPDEKQPDKDNLHQDHMIDDNPKEKKEKRNLVSRFDPRNTFKGWTLVL